MWYVIQTIGGQEEHVLMLIKKLLDNSLFEELFVPHYEVLKRRAGTWCKRRDVLLPGYLFVITKSPSLLQESLRSIPKFTRLLANNDVFVPLDRGEVAFINAFTQAPLRVVEISQGVVEGDRIVILRGPLMHKTGLIKKVDRHKRIAFLEVDILGRTKQIKVGLEIVRKKPL